MTYLANTAQIREADRMMIEEHHYPGLLLMETAGRRTAELLLDHYADQRHFLVLAGPGNNGGDGLVIARYLHFAGKEVRIFYAHDPAVYKGDAAINDRIVRDLPVPGAVFSEERATQWLTEWASRPVLVDALLGTGIRATVREPVAAMLDFFRKQGLPTAAVDLPSGLDADTGACIQLPLPAEHTYTFQLPKICHLVTPSSLHCGQVHVLDIGIWPSVVERLGIRREVLDDAFFQRHTQVRKPDDHKGRLGHVLVVGGSRDMSGAAAMTAFSAIKSGVGLCTVFAPVACRQAVFSLVPEAMCLSPEEETSTLGAAAASLFAHALVGKSAVVIGPGMGTSAETLAFIRMVLPMIRVPVLLDADMLNLLAAHPDLWELLPMERVLTPHPGEMRRLTACDVIGERLESAESFALLRQSVIVLKGAGTVVAAPDGTTYVNTTGNPGMATGGSGDVLSGMIGAMLAQGYTPAIAAALGVFLHGRAGDLAAAKWGEAGLAATDIARFAGRGWRAIMERK